jgi:hypothetical protein
MEVKLNGSELTLNLLTGVQCRSPIPSVIEIHLTILEMGHLQVRTDNPILYALNAFRIKELLK